MQRLGSMVHFSCSMADVLLCYIAVSNGRPNPDCFASSSNSVALRLTHNLELTGTKTRTRVDMVRIGVACSAQPWPVRRPCCAFA